MFSLNDLHSDSLTRHLVVKLYTKIKFTDVNHMTVAIILIMTVTAELINLSRQIIKVHTRWEFKMP